MALAYSYIRMSRPEQIRGDSLRRQTATADAWAASRGLRIDDTLRDIGVSAYRGKNRTEGALGGFLKMVDEGRIARGSFLIVESLDRLSREAVLETVPRFIDLINAGVIVVTLMDKQEYSKERLTADWTPLILIVVPHQNRGAHRSVRPVRTWGATDPDGPVPSDLVPRGAVPLTAAHGQ